MADMRRRVNRFGANCDFCLHNRRLLFLENGRRADSCVSTRNRYASSRKTALKTSHPALIERYKMLQENGYGNMHFAESASRSATVAGRYPRIQATLFPSLQAHICPLSLTHYQLLHYATSYTQSDPLQAYRGFQLLIARSVLFLRLSSRAVTKLTVTAAI